MNLNTVLREAITKGAVSATRKPIATLRSDVAELKRQVPDIKRQLRDMQKCVKQAPAPEAEVDKPAGIRPTGVMVRKLRAKLGLTQAQLAKLLGVSGHMVSLWECSQGRIMLRARNSAALARVRAMGKAEARETLGGD